DRKSDHGHGDCSQGNHAVSDRRVLHERTIVCSASQANSRCRSQGQCRQPWPGQTGPAWVLDDLDVWAGGVNTALFPATGETAPRQGFGSAGQFGRAMKDGDPSPRAYHAPAVRTSRSAGGRGTRDRVCDDSGRARGPRSLPTGGDRSLQCGRTRGWEVERRGRKERRGGEVGKEGGGPAQSTAQVGRWPGS